jgi:hypothetical protein
LSPDMVAMIPVDEERAQQKKWDMPFGPLLRRLEERCRGRVIRADRSAGTIKAGPKPDRLTNQEWQTFCEQLTPDPEDRLFIEFRIPLAARMAAP